MTTHSYKNRKDTKGFRVRPGGEDMGQGGPCLLSAKTLRDRTFKERGFHRRREGPLARGTHTLSTHMFPGV